MLERRSAHIQRVLRSLSPRRITSDLSDEESEELVSNYFRDFKDHRKLGIFFVARYPTASLRALSAMYRLPLVDARLGAGPEAAAVHRLLYRTSPLGRTLIHQLTAVLALPAQGSDYSQGATKQTLRRKARAAQKLGVYWKEVVDVDERQRLLRLANDQERAHAIEAYREEDPHNDDLLDGRLWLAAYSSEDQPILLSVTPIEGEWAVLRYFRALGEGDAPTNSRYLMTQVLVEHLVPRGVRWLADTSSPVGLTNGLRHFQRMLGFKIIRVRMDSRPPAAAAGRARVTDEVPAPALQEPPVTLEVEHQPLR